MRLAAKVAEEGGILEALTESVLNGFKDKSLTDADRPAARLAWAYASAIDAAIGTSDEADTLKDLGPKLHALLNDLGLTPRGRRQPAKNDGEVKTDDSPRAKLLALQGERGARARHNRAAPVHPATA